MPLKINYYSYNLPFKYPFTTARGTKTHQSTLVVELSYMGIKGLGEAPAIYYYDVSVEKMIADIEEKRTVLESYAFQEPERFWHFLHHLFPKNNFLVCALDMAGWDIWGKMRNKPLYQLIGPNQQHTVKTDYTIGIDSPEAMVQKVLENPWPIYKIKVGFEGDVDIVAHVKKSTNATIRVDANSGWQVDEALDKINALADLGVELVEEPIERFNYQAMQQIFPLAKTLVFADESCCTLADVKKCKDAFHGINIKLTKCGGITPAIEMIDQAKSLGLKVMMGCMNESTIGSAAMAHFAPQLDYLDMDGTLLLTEDTATGLIIENDGTVVIPQKPGLGVEKI
jgi:L-Ala-D/L-Glu epimerase